MLNGDIIAAIERFAPRSFQESWDNTGLQVGSPFDECRGVMLCVDCTPEVVDEAIARGCTLIVSHHPLIFRGLKHLTGSTPVESAVMKAITAGVSIYSSHTALDSTPGGVSYEMARRLGVSPVRVLEAMSPRWVRLSVMVPQSKADELRLALFDAGCGEIACGENGRATGYDCCSFNIDGTGTFRPLEGSHPYVGAQDSMHFEPEVKISMLCSRNLLSRAQSVIREVHPYECPAVELIVLENTMPGIGLGIVGNLDEGLTAQQLIERVKQTFDSPVVRHTSIADPQQKLRRVAMCGGSGGEFIPKAIAAGAQAYICSDIRYHDFVDYQREILLIDIGHFESEELTKHIFYHVITQNFANFAVYKSSVEKNPIKYS